MLFNSAPYIFIFLPVAMAVYFLLAGRHCVDAAKWWLVAASIVFYAWWNPRNVPILFGSILVNWMVVTLIWRAPGDREAGRLLAAGVAFNVLYLGLFKYYDFIATSLNGWWDGRLPLVGVALPLGISFFTLTQIAYLVDAREGLVQRQRFQNFSLFVLFFPHLIIGPILHHKDMMPQFESLRTKVFSLANVSAGMLRFAIGFAKKALIADPLATYTHVAFDDSAQLGATEAWQAMLAFTFQLYFDFSGYVDMALGSAMMLNIRMPENFRGPLRSRSIIEFWSRWHMTLTNFLTTYIYTPLLYALGRPTLARSLVAVFVTFFISGIWHGAAWTFILFGTAHGTALAINHAWRRSRLPMPAALGWLLTFLFVGCTFVLFRARTVDDAMKVFAGMAGQGAAQAGTLEPFLAAVMAAAAAVAFLLPNSQDVTAAFRRKLGGPGAGR